jgi:hypothetical protein
MFVYCYFRSEILESSFFHNFYVWTLILSYWIPLLYQMLKYTRNSYWRNRWYHKFKVTEGIWTYTCAFPNKRQSTSPKGCTILLCIKQICPFNVWRWRNAMTPSEAISHVKMKFLSSQMADRLKGLYCRTGVRRYAEVWCKVV